MNKLLSTTNILRALFDIKPVDGAGQVDVRKIAKMMPVVNLANQKPAINGRLASINSMRKSGLPPDKFNDTPLKNKVNTPVDIFGSVEMRGIEPPSSQVVIRSSHQAIPTVQPAYQEKLISQDELEKYLNSKLDIKKELKNIGGKTVVRRKLGKPRYRPIFVSQKSGLPTSQVDIINDFASPTDLRSQYPIDDYQTILSQINQRVLPETDGIFVGEPRKIDPFERLLTISDVRGTSDIKPSPEIDSWVRYAKSQSPITNNQSSHQIKIPKPDLAFLVAILEKTAEVIRNIFCDLFNKRNFPVAGVIGLTALAFVLMGQYGIGVKNEILKESNLAVANLEKANENLRLFDFEAASNNFAEAYGEFSKAGENLNFIGASITSIFAELPGFDKLTAGGAGKLKSAKNLVEAGKLLAEAGRSMSEAVSSLSQTGAILELTTSDVRGTSDVQDIFGDLKKSLLASSKNLSKANVLLADVSADALPEDKRETFAEFKSKLPELESVVSDAVEYTNFLEGFINASGTKKYLILFQNSSELRPTGGFPGTYAVVTFNNGRLSDILVDDVYNLDGQLKENIIPPRPLQHITPNWGMRDANWFVDFSVSAQKTIEFFKKGSGYEVDGVITMSPRIISDILKVVGPIKMPEYDLTINSENFLPAIQAEVEYGDNRQQPKKVVVDMAPRLLERIYSSDPGRWLDIFNVFVSGMDKKDILMYFKDLGLENFVAKKGFGGLVKNSSDDYLMVTFSNVKGSKTDKVTDNSIKTSVRFENGRMVHKLQLTRQHNGGLTKYGFYNKQNPAYVRVLVPEGSEFISVSGNSNPDYKPLINYMEGNFKEDRDLLRLESGFRIESENGVSIYRESGKTGFAFWLVTDPGQTKTVELQYAVPFESGKDSYDIYVQKQPGLEVDNFEFQVGDAYIYNGEFDKDLELRFKIDN